MNFPNLIMIAINIMYTASDKYVIYEDWTRLSYISQPKNDHS